MFIVGIFNMLINETLQNINSNALSIMPKKSHFRAANAIFGKIGRYASEDVTL